MSNRVLHSKRPRSGPAFDVLENVRGVMRGDHPHARYDRYGNRLTPYGHFMPAKDNRRGIPLRSQALVQSFFIDGVAAYPSRYFAPHKYGPTPPRARKSRGLMNRALAISAAHSSSVSKLSSLHRAGFAAAVPDPDLALSHVHPCYLRRRVRYETGALPVH